MAQQAPCEGCSDPTLFDKEWGGFACSICLTLGLLDNVRPMGTCEGCKKPFTTTDPLAYTPGWSIPYHRGCIEADHAALHRYRYRTSTGRYACLAGPGHPA